MRYDVLNQLKANSEWMDKHMDDDTFAEYQWARAKAHAAIALYHQGDFDAIVCALATETAQLLKLIDDAQKEIEKLRSELASADSSINSMCATVREHGV